MSRADNALQRSRRKVRRGEIFVSPQVQVVKTKIEEKTIFFAAVSAADGVQRKHFLGEFYEQSDLVALKRWVKPGGVFCDIGANVGNHTIWALKFMGAKRAIVFEPNPDAIAILRTNLALNNLEDLCDTSFLGLGVGAKAGEGFAIETIPNVLGRGQLRAGKGQIKIVAGDEALDGQGVTFIKIDVEGMELLVLDGLEKTIRQSQPMIFIEVDDENAAAFEVWRTRSGYEIAERFRRYKNNENYLLVRPGTKPKKDASPVSRAK